jgi:hypothetical protein
MNPSRHESSAGLIRGSGSLLVVAFLLGAGVLRAEPPGPPPPWVPEGYVFLGYEESFQMMRSGEGRKVGEVNQRNSALLDAALAKMTVPELEALLAKMRDYVKNDAPAWELRNYALLVGVHAGEHLRLLQSRHPDSFDAIVQAQEAASAGFADDPEAVSREAERLERLLGKQPNSELYLALLKPLRARPWNSDARRVLHEIVKQDEPSGTYPADRGKFLILKLAALEFVHKRQAEQPNQGAWYSLEATLRDLPEQPPGGYYSQEEAHRARDAGFAPLRALWERAIALRSRDDEAHSMAIILARLDGDAEKEREAMASYAQGGLSEKAAIEHNVRLVADDYLTPGMRERLYKASLRSAEGATDWAGRLETLQSSPNYELVVADTSALLELPEKTLPQPYRVELLSLNLQRRLASHHGEQHGFCDEIAKQLPSLERQALAAYPPAADPNLPQPPHQLGEVAGLRREVVEGKQEVEKLDRLLLSHADPDGKALTGEQEQEVRRLRDELARESQQAEQRVAGKTDQAVLAEWNRRELEEWRGDHQQEQGSRKVLPLGEAERLTLQVRADLADCYRTEERFVEAAAVVDGCLLPRPGVDSPCVVALANVGSALARRGSLREGVAVYRKLAAAAVDPQRLDALREIINTAAPGTL